MSDSMIKIIPANPFCKIPELLLQKCRDFLETQIPCDFLEIKCSNTPVFVDCGGNLDRIICPKCNTKLSFAWWGNAMNKAAENDFTSLQVKLPCCGETSSLNDLEYHFPCGFACCEIDIMNPDSQFEICITETIQNILGVNVRIIKAHI